MVCDEKRKALCKGLSVGRHILCSLKRPACVAHHTARHNVVCVYAGRDTTAHTHYLQSKAKVILF